MLRGLECRLGKCGRVPGANGPIVALFQRFEHCAKPKKRLTWGRPVWGVQGCKQPYIHPIVSRRLPALEESANSGEVLEARLLPFVGGVVDADIGVVNAEHGGHFAGAFFGT